MQRIQTICLIRHGEITQQKPSRFIGQSNIPLTGFGKSQMRRLRDHLESFGIDRYYCSPLDRCVDSAAILAERSERQPEKIAELSEISLGQWEGLSVSEVRARFPGSHEQRSKNIRSFRPVDGESFQDLQDRCWPAFEAIVRRTVHCTAIITHAGVNRSLLCRLMGMPLENLFRIEQNYGCLNVIKHWRGAYQLQSMNFLPGL